MNIVLKLLSSPWFWADVFLSVVGGVLVFWGLRLEKSAEPKENLDAFVRDIKQQKLTARRGWRILMLGIIVEVVAALGISVISSLEIAVLNEKAELASKAAADANKLAADVQGTNLMLRKQVAKLELRLQPRRITMEQVKDFMFLTERVGKIPIKIVINGGQQEQMTFACDLRAMFTKAGFTINADAGEQEINMDPSLTFGQRFGTSTDVPDVMLVLYSPTNQVVVDTTPIWTAKFGNTLTHTETKLAQPVFIGTTSEVWSAIEFSLNQIGINAYWTCSSNVVRSSEFCLIYVMPK